MTTATRAVTRQGSDWSSCLGMPSAQFVIIATIWGFPEPTFELDLHLDQGLVIIVVLALILVPALVPPTGTVYR